jgi:hypothetical protein
MVSYPGDPKAVQGILPLSAGCFPFGSKLPHMAFRIHGFSVFGKKNKKLLHAG